MSAPHDRNSSAVTRAQRKTLMLGMRVALPLAFCLWFAVYGGLPPLAEMDDPGSRLAFALKCCCVAVLLCFFLGIEAVAHERLHTRAINPLAGAESARMKVNLHYLQQTLEQLMVFIPGLLALSLYCTDGHSMRAVAATAVVWIVARFVYWIGYHKAPRYRAPGLVGMIQSALVLLYVCARFGDELAGVPGAVVMVGLFVAGELYLVGINRDPPA